MLFSFPAAFSRFFGTCGGYRRGAARIGWRRADKRGGMSLRAIGKAFVSLLTSLGLCLYSLGGVGGELRRTMIERPADERMRNVRIHSRASGSAASPAPSPAALAAAQAELHPAAVFPDMDVLESAGSALGGAQEEDVLETTIEGGMRIRNETSYWVDAAQILTDGPGLTLPADGPQILIIHTHASEAYTQAGLDRYAPSDAARTEDTQFNVVRIGDELTDIFSAAGLGVIHDRGIYDYPSYTGSYARSGQAAEQMLESCPTIRIVLDIHRDALGSEGVVYKTMAEEEGSVASQVMLLVGTDESGLPHPGWRGNLALAMYLQNAVNSSYPTLMRPVALVPQRYNQQLAPGSLLIEVGSSGNTLREALAAIRLFGSAAAPALAALVEEDSPEEA